MLLINMCKKSSYAFNGYKMTFDIIVRPKLIELFGALEQHDNITKLDEHESSIYTVNLCVLLDTTL